MRRVDHGNVPYVASVISAISVLSSSLPRLARAAWQALREWSGDAAYERYLCSAAKPLQTGPKLSAVEFYLDQLRRKYSKLSRCC